MAFVKVKNDEALRGFFEGIFTDEFMKAHTNFESFEYFRYSSAVIADWTAAEMVYNEELLDLFVKESTEYGSFEEMIRAAVAEEKEKEKTIG